MAQLKDSHAVEGLPSSPAKPLASWYAQGLSDGLGDRLLMFDNSGAPSLELLRFRPDFAQVPGFEAALRERVQRLGNFRHPAFAQVRSVQRLEPDDDLALISNCTPGKRLSEVLHQAHGSALAAALIRHLAPALVLLQQHGAGISHGVLSPDRIVVSPDGRLTIVEHVVGPAIDTLNLRTAELASIGIALPPAARDATPRLDVATDWYQLGLVAMSVLAGRPVTATDLSQLETLLDGPGLSPFMRQWLGRALQISGTRIESGAEAREALDELLQKERPSDSRRIGSLRQEKAAPSAPSPTTFTGRLAGLVSGSPKAVESDAEVPDVSPAIDEPTRHIASADEPTPNAVELFPLEQAPVPAPTEAPSTPEVRAPSAARQGPVQVRTLFGHEPSAAKTRAVDPGGPAALHVPPAAKRPPLQQRRAAGRRTVSISVVVAVVLIAAAEAGVIAVLTRALWLAPSLPITVETTASGDNMLVSSRWPKAAPLGVTVAPDLRWVRVTSRTSAGILGEKITSTSGGTIRISSPIELKVFEDSRLLGSVPGAALNIPAGRHDIELVNLALGYRLRQAVEVEAGQTVSIHVVPPAGSVTVDASPWADVSIDGQTVGRTPLGPLSLAPGEHEFTFRHPAGGKDRQRLMVKSDQKARVIGILRR